MYARATIPKSLSPSRSAEAEIVLNEKGPALSAFYFSHYLPQSMNTQLPLCIGGRQMLMSFLCSPAQWSIITSENYEPVTKDRYNQLRHEFRAGGSVSFNSSGLSYLYAVSSSGREITVILLRAGFFYSLSPPPPFFFFHPLSEMFSMSFLLKIRVKDQLMLGAGKRGGGTGRKAKSNQHSKRLLSENQRREQ